MVTEINKTIVLVLKKSYGWEFCPVIGVYNYLVNGYVIIDDRGNQKMIEKNEVYDYYPESEQELENDRFYYLNRTLIHKMGERDEH